MFEQIHHPTWIGENNLTGRDAENIWRHFEEIVKSLTTVGHFFSRSLVFTLYHHHIITLSHLKKRIFLLSKA